MSALRPFRPEHIAACLSKTGLAYSVSIVTPALRAAMDDACQRVFSGSNAGGVSDAACMNSYECAPALVCDRALCAPTSKAAANDPCNEPGAVCPASQFCGGDAPLRRCADKRLTGQACDAATPCLDTLRCAAGLCADKVMIGGACGSDNDCAAVAPYCDPYNGNRCYQGFKPSLGTAECSAFGASSCPTGFVAKSVCTRCGPAGGCAAQAVCARVCTQFSDCAGDNLDCSGGACQVTGCI
jgi:hypothetical protein